MCACVRPLATSASRVAYVEHCASENHAVLKHAHHLWHSRTRAFQQAMHSLLNHGHEEISPRPRPSLIKSPLPHSYLSPGDLPKSYDIRNLNGKSLATDNRNQHIPQCVDPLPLARGSSSRPLSACRYCGSCWAHAATSALSDRINILRGGATPFVHLAPQVLVHCVTTADPRSGMNHSHGCGGGDTTAAFAYVRRPAPPLPHNRGLRKPPSLRPSLPRARPVLD